jgi:hypothetical protein
MPIRLGSDAHTATKDEHRVLCEQLGPAVNALIALVLPEGVPGLPKVISLDGAPIIW